MTAHRYTSQGTAFVTRADPGRTRHTGARFERPVGEPPVWAGALILAAGLLTIVAAILLTAAILSHQAPPRSPSAAADARTSNAASPETARQREMAR